MQYSEEALKSIKEIKNNHKKMCAAVGHHFSLLNKCNYGLVEYILKEYILVRKILEKGVYYIVYNDKKKKDVIRYAKKVSIELLPKVSDYLAIKFPDNTYMFISDMYTDMMWSLSKKKLIDNYYKLVRPIKLEFEKNKIRR